MENIVKQRLREVFKQKNVTVNSIYKELNIPQTTLNNQINGETEVSINTVIAIIDLYEDICCEWLLTGKGEMIKNEQNLEHVKNSVAIGRDANGSEIHVTSQNVEEFIRITGKYQEHTDKMLAIIEKLINK
jgi:plasmid maintenance system antidote protein VapI